MPPKEHDPSVFLRFSSFYAVFDGLHDDPRLPCRERKADDANGNNHAKRNTFDRGRRIEWRNNHFVPPSSKFDVIRNPNAVSAEDYPGCDGQYESSDPFQGVCGRFGRGFVFCVEHDLCSLLWNLIVFCVAVAPCHRHS